MSPTKKPNPWHSFKPIGDLRLERGEESEGGWGILALLNFLAAVFGWFMGMFFYLRVVSRATRYSRLNNTLNEESLNTMFWVCGCAGVIICTVSVTVLWFKAGRKSPE